MKRYLQHVRRSRERLAPFVERMSENGFSLMVRGTIGEPRPDSLTCDTHKEHCSVPFYCGYPGSLDTHAATLILDATMRKSISFSFMHFFKEFLPHSKSPDILPQIQDYHCEKGLLLTLIYGKNRALGSFKHLARLENSRARSVYEAFRAGNEIIPTYSDLDISIMMMGRYLESDPNAILVPMRVSELGALASKVRKGSKSIADFLRKPECYILGAQTLEKVSEPPPAFEEELKGHMWNFVSQGSPLRCDVELFLLCVGLEVAMMEKAICEIETNSPIKASRQGRL